jgi:hypothetical protein
MVPMRVKKKVGGLLEPRCEGVVRRRKGVNLSDYEDEDENDSAVGVKKTSRLSLNLFSSPALQGGAPGYSSRHSRGDRFVLGCPSHGG